ncbi:MAG: VWA domain-containing protein [Bacteroidia bacterium]|jgi:Ca-activated chloride channel family protein|nr:VWA domain-containing protein [Bacteroidia bacterium]
MSFEYPWMLLLLLAFVPVWLLFLHTSRRRQERLNRFADTALMRRLLKGDSPALRNWRFILVSGALLIVLFCAAGPRIRGGKETVVLNGVDIVLAIDISNSMRANDLQPNRLERTKLEVARLLQKSENDRFGIVVFAGRAIPQLPLTNDKGSALSVIEALSTGDIMRQGTNIEEAIQIATRSFGEDGKARALVIISDGESHEGDPVAAARELAEKKNVIVSCIGVGSASGSTIPEIDNYGKMIGDKLDENGQKVITRLNEDLLQQIASAGGGSYVKATASDFGLGQIYGKLQGLNKTTTYLERFTSYRTLVPWLLIGALVLLLTETLLPEGKRK